MNKEAEALLPKLLQADHDYYVRVKPILSDNEYDRMAERFCALEPNHPYSRKVGAKVPVDARKVTHRIVAGSQDKLKSPDEIKNWVKDNIRPTDGYLQEWKLDGMTLVLQYTDGCLTEAATRGDGEVGESVLFNAVNIPSIPKRLPVPFTGDVRGELLLSKTKYTEFFQPLGHKTCRNSVAVVRDQKGTNLARHLDLIVFEYEPLDPLDGRWVYPTEQMRIEFMRNLGFRPVESIFCQDAVGIQNAFKTYFVTNRDEFDYEADGTVVKMNSVQAQKTLGMSSDNCPKGQKAIKFANDTAESTIIGVELTIGSTGAIIPTLKYNPVDIQGVTCKSVLANNFPYLMELGGVCIGDKVVIERAGGVIPHIKEVFPRYDHQTKERIGELIVAPSTCPFCDEPLVVDGASTKCINESCEGRGIQVVKQWITKRNILFIGDVLLQALYDNGTVTQPQDLYKLTYSTLERVRVGNGVLGTANAHRIIGEINKSRNCDLNDLMGSVCIKFLGRRECEIIMEKTGIDTIDGWFSLTATYLLSVGGYKDKKAYTIVKGIQRARPMIEALLEAIKINEKELPPTVDFHPLFNQLKEAPMPGFGNGDPRSQVKGEMVLMGDTLLFTGKIERCDDKGERFTRKRMQDLAAKQGARIEEDFRPSVTMLVTAEMDSTSGKMKKAKAAGIKIVSEADFFKMLGM
jgi:DNA ligase (NAD+)